MRVFLYWSVVLVFFIALSSPRFATAEATPSNDIKKAAKEGMKAFIRSDRLEHLHGHGFDSKEDVEKAELGEGFEIFTISAEKILDESVFQDLQSLVTTTNQWSFFILVNGEVKNIVTVALIDGRWTPFELGSPQFAKIIANFFKIWPASAGYRWRYVRIYQASASFTEVYQKDKLIGIVPSSTLTGLKTGKPPKDYDPRNLINPDGIVSTIRPAVKRNIELWK